MFELEIVKEIRCPECESLQVKHRREERGDLIINHYECKSCSHSQEEVQ